MENVIKYVTGFFGGLSSVLMAVLPVTILWTVLTGGMSENKVIELSENDLNTLLRNVVSKKKDKLKENLLRDV